MIHNLTRDTIIASRVDIAQDPWGRMKGLLGTSGLSKGAALIIKDCRSIHMFFMKYPIDVIFCDRKDKVVGLCADIKPFRLSPIFFQASYAIELPSGTIPASKTLVGDQIELRVATP